MIENRLCKYCLEGLIQTDASNDFCCEEHRAKYSGSRWLVLFNRIDSANTQEAIEK